MYINPNYCVNGDIDTSAPWRQATFENKSIEPVKIKWGYDTFISSRGYTFSPPPGIVKVVVILPGNFRYDVTHASSMKYRGEGLIDSFEGAGNALYHTKFFRNITGQNPAQIGWEYTLNVLPGQSSEQRIFPHPYNRELERVMLVVQESSSKSTRYFLRAGEKVVYDGERSWMVL